MGNSTLVVSLPKEWVKEVGLDRGKVVSLISESDGTLHILPKMTKERKNNMRAVINSDRCLESGLLSKIVTGLYSLGYDTIQVISRKGLCMNHLKEMRRTTQELTGINVIEQTLDYMTLQNFIDPSRFPVDGLLRRLYIITTSMHNAAFRALKERRQEDTFEIMRMMNEVDQIYWLAVRQLLVSVRDRSIRKNIGEESDMHILYEWIVAKFLEFSGNCAISIAKEVFRLFELKLIPDDDVLKSTYHLHDYIKEIYNKAMNAFFAFDIKLANTVVGMVEETKIRLDSLNDKIFTNARGTAKERSSKSSFCSYLSMRVIINDLGHLAEACATIAEITINRNLKAQNEYVRFENE